MQGHLEGVGVALGGIAGAEQARPAVERASHRGLHRRKRKTALEIQRGIFIAEFKRKFKEIVAAVEQGLRDGRPLGLERCQKIFHQIVHQGETFTKIYSIASVVYSCQTRGHPCLVIAVIILKIEGEGRARVVLGVVLVGEELALRALRDSDLAQRLEHRYLDVPLQLPHVQLEQCYSVVR